MFNDGTTKNIVEIGLNLYRLNQISNRFALCFRPAKMVFGEKKLDFRYRYTIDAFSMQSQIGDCMIEQQKRIMKQQMEQSR